MEFIQQAFYLFHKGGIVMIPLAVCSLFVAAIVVERYCFFRASVSDVSLLLNQLTPAISKAIGTRPSRCARTQKAALRLLHKLHWNARSRDILVVERAIEGAAAIKAAKLRDRLQYLEFIVTLSPLLGLLGTVVGMIQSFSVMNLREGQPFAITGGVGEALVATAAGLCVAIFALVAHAYFSRQLDRLITDMEETGYHLLNAIRGESIETA